MKSKFHRHGTFFFRSDFFRVSVRLDERFIIDGRLPPVPPTEKESRVDTLSAFPPDRRESND